MGPNPVAHSFTFVSDVRLYVRWVPRQCWRACPWMGLASLQLFCILICSMSFPPNLYDFHWILLSFDSKVLKRERSCQLVHRLQKSGCECVCVCVCAHVCDCVWELSHHLPFLASLLTSTTHPCAQFPFLCLISLLEHFWRQENFILLLYLYLPNTMLNPAAILKLFWRKWYISSAK